MVEFIGAGNLLKTEEKIIGLTTAATLWTTAAIGVIVGAGFYVLAIITTALTYLSLKLGIFTSS